MGDNGNNVSRGHSVRPESDPFDLRAADWHEVFMRSGIFKCWVAKEVKGPWGKKQVIVKRAHKAAFALKPGGAVEFELRDEDTYIAFREVKHGLETALTYKTFSEHAAKFALSGGYYSITAGLGLDITGRKEQTDSHNVKKETSKLHISYNVPRVSLFLNESPLRVSDDLQQWLEEKTEGWQKESDKEKRLNILQQDLPVLLQEFGGVFCLKVLLGGRLHSLQEIRDAKTSDRKILRDEKKFEISANVMSPVAGGTISGSRAKGRETDEEKVATSSSSQLSIESQGGNPLVCCRPSDWLLSVGSSYYWRVIDQDEPENLLSIIQLFGDEFSEITKAYINGLRDVFNDATEQQGPEEQREPQDKWDPQEQRGLEEQHDPVEQREPQEQRGLEDQQGQDGLRLPPLEEQRLPADQRLQATNGGKRKKRKRILGFFRIGSGR